jgi:hypothetical protein
MGAKTSKPAPAPPSLYDVEPLPPYIPVVSIDEGDVHKNLDQGAPYSFIPTGQSLAAVEHLVVKKGAQNAQQGVYFIRASDTTTANAPHIAKSLRDREAGPQARPDSTRVFVQTERGQHSE